MHIPCRISDSRYTPLPFFVFGDFNFRLDTLSLVQVIFHFSCEACVFTIAYPPGVLTHTSTCFSRSCEQHLSTSAKVQTVKKDSTNEVEKIIWEEKDNDHQVMKSSPVTSFFFFFNDLFVYFCATFTFLCLLLHPQVLLHIEEKLFTYLHQAVFREDNGRAVSIQSLHMDPNSSITTTEKTSLD